MTSEKHSKQLPIFIEVDVPDNSPQSDHIRLRETANPPRNYKTPKASVSMLNINIHLSAIRKRLNKYGQYK